MNEESVEGEKELVQSEQTEVVVRKFDDGGNVVSKTVTVTTEYMQKVNIDHTGLYL